MGGGSGLKYAVSSIVYLGKKKKKMVQKLWVILYIVKITSQELQKKMW